MRRCIDFGASGFVPKTTPIEGMREAVRKVLDGEIWTPPDVDLSGPADKETADLVRRIEPPPRWCPAVRADENEGSIVLRAFRLAL